MPPLTRTFIAVPIGDRARQWVRGLVEQSRAAIEVNVGPVRWVSPAQYHFTLRFFGDLDRPALDRAVEAGEAAARRVEPFEVSLGELGGFPDLRRPRVLWIGVRHPGADHLRALVATLDEALRSLGFGPADRPFEPHLTLGRRREGTARGAGSGGTGPGSLAGIEAGGPCPSFRVEQMTVMASRLTPSGPLYTPIKTLRIGSRGLWGEEGES